MALVGVSEKETNGVLQSMISVDGSIKSDSELVIDDGDQSPTCNFEPNLRNNENDGQIQWITPVSLASHPLFASIDPNVPFQQTVDNHQVIWEGHTVQVDSDQSHLSSVFNNEENGDILEATSPRESPKHSKTKPGVKTKNTPNKKKKKCSPLTGGVNNEPTKLEESAVQVKERFKRGCECQDESCFRGLNADNVYKHRLNIAELTKAEHDMYLMGVTMACLANPDETVRHKERRRLRAQYVYQGRRVCLDAFLYLENCTHYQLKRIRKHVMTHGVAPRIHGNHGKKPHNTFPLDIYRHATEFLKQFLKVHVSNVSSNLKQVVQLPWDITRKNLHDAYKEYGQIIEPGIKLMGYSTFRHFMKEQFPHVKFCKIEPKHNAQAQQQPQQQADNTQPLHNHVQKPQIHVLERPQEPIQNSVLPKAEIQQVIPLVVTPNDCNTSQHHHQTFLVTPVSHQIIQNGNIISAQNSTAHTPSNTFSYQLTNAGYVINEQGNIITSMPSAQPQTSYTYNRM